MIILTTKLNRFASYAVVLAKMYKGQLQAVTYTNYTQAERKLAELRAAGVDCEVFSTGVVKYIRINS